MGVLIMNCPHEGCSATHAAFVARGLYISQENGWRVHWTTMSCPVCHRAVLVKLNAPQEYDLIKLNSNIQDVAGIHVVQRYPDNRSLDAPEHVDPNVARTFARANGAIKRGESETAGMLLRKMLDTVLTDKFPHTGSGMLGSKMGKLIPNQDIPEAMVNWAIEVKDFGNEAAHESHEPDIDQIKELRDFSELLLEYVYTLPERLRQMREHES